MKTEFQIQSFLSSIIYKTKEDAQGVSLYVQHNLKVTPPKTISTSDSGMTFQDFIEWYNNGFGAGDVVSKDGNTYIVETAKQDGITVSGKLEGDSVIRVNLSFSYNEMKLVNEAEYLNFYKALRNSDLQFFKSTGKLQKRFVPSYGTKVMFYNRTMEGLGVFRGFDKENEKLEFLCYYIKNTQEIKHSMHESIPDDGSISFEPITLAQIKTLNRNLGKCNKVWNDHVKRVEPLDLQVPVGETYWYLDETLKIRSAVDKRDKKSGDRLRAGNYCRSLEEAMDWVAEIHENRERKLAE